MKRPRARDLARRLAATLLCIICLAGCAVGLTASGCSSLERVSLQLQWVTQAQFAGYYVALEKGWYLEEGIDLTIVPGGPDRAAIELVASGECDFGTSFLADLCVAVREGTPVLSIAQIQQANGQLLIAMKSSGIEEPKDFVGKRVSVWLGSWEAQFDTLMANEGIAFDDFELVSQGYSIDPFIVGEVDVASAMVYNEYQTVLEKGLAAEDLNVIDYADYGLGFPGDVLFTTTEITKRQPDLCTRMLRASLRGWEYAIDHQEEAVDIVLKYDETGLRSRVHQVSMMREIAKLVSVAGREIGYSDRTTVKQTIYILRQNVISGPLQPEDVCTNDFWQEVQGG